MRNTSKDLAPELQAFASLLDAQPAEVQEAFQFLVATATQEAGRFELLKVAEVEGRWDYTFSGAGEVFGVVRAEMEKEMERKVGEEVREILGGEGLLWVCEKLWWWAWRSWCCSSAAPRERS